MPTQELVEPTTRITINLFSRDIAYLKRTSDQYQVEIRDIIRAYCRAKQMREVFDDA